MLRALAFLLAVACSAIASGQTPPRDTSVTPTGTAHIRGRVTDTSGRPLGYAEVRAGSASGDPANGLTDRDGRFDLADLPAGTYTVSAVKPTYLRSSWGEARPGGPGRPTTLADGETVNNIIIRLARGGVITGKIVDEFGDPVVDAQVTPMRYQFVQGTRRLMPTGASAITNDIGEYRVYGLATGQYYVSAALRAFAPAGSTPTDRVAYAPTFYPGTGNVAEAQRLTIAPGQTITAINLTLAPVATSSISGTVFGSDGGPASGGTVTLTSKSPSAGFNSRSASIGAGGRFTVSSVTPGDYLLRGNIPATQESALIEVIAAGSDVSGVQIVTAKPSRIRGRIAFTASATSTDPPKPTAIALGAQREWMLGQRVRDMARIKEDGTFEITLGSGHVQLRAGTTETAAGGSPPWRLNRVLHDGIDVGDSGLEVPPNATIENVVVEMTNRSVELTGRVADGDGRKVRDCFVIVFAQDADRWTVETRYLGVTEPRTGDRYHVRLLPGEYYAVAMTDVPAGAWTDRDFLSLAREHATKVSIAPGDAQTLDLVVSPAPVF
ncbi:MAG TPA: carboxypeptidase-like regulatory domain-containing protein [Vicinamibacterales bacterium]|nr:carboxypeptidase-like regulatory domain-containing protein [Vicinamibacterales bacterium]